ncbi:metal dependent phosphohydrolase [Syntrophobotulus glycolicus DSM 8271]|uniref:Metal dependent phosphohydrolase n=1 Tax=Syntrophobotulus glycolicus (strain DSM 8271 / FlGlyR) TaxID=645991 RepID=F0T043_SYNGF|nr:HD domain-containing protein [Syntrophobotulus glycolicus]ADY56130.1 metal dependent phosphohydrolase [Syntrophobotulus glycolicus DSM 8271]
MDKNRIAQQVRFIFEIDKLKNVIRQSRISDNSREENDAEHSWHLAVMALILREYANDKDLDIFKVIKMLLIHDIVEIYAGDVHVYDIEGNKDKSIRERKAAEKIFSLLPSDQAEEYQSLWLEFDSRITNESKYANSIDRLQPIMLNCTTEGHTWKKFEIKSPQVYEKNGHIKDGSEEIWSLVQKLLASCVQKGYLSEE